MGFNNPQMTMVWNEKSRSQIKLHEGYRQDIYIDSVGVLTGGYGHALHKGSILPKYIWDEIFNVDFDKAKDGAMDLINQRGWWDIGYVRRNVIINMVFNLGLAGLFGFKGTLAAIDNRDFTKAAIEMLDSKWAKQVGDRAITLAEQMRTGVA